MAVFYLTVQMTVRIGGTMFVNWNRVLSGALESSEAFRLLHICLQYNDANSIVAAVNRELPDFTDEGYYLSEGEVPMRTWKRSDIADTMLAFQANFNEECRHEDDLEDDLEKVIGRRVGVPAVRIFNVYCTKWEESDFRENIALQLRLEDMRDILRALGDSEGGYLISSNGCLSVTMFRFDGVSYTLLSNQENELVAIPTRLIDFSC